MTGFYIPDQDVAAFPIQSHIFRDDLEIIAGGFLRQGIRQGCAVTAQGTPDMTVHVAAGLLAFLGKPDIVITAGDLTVDTADATLIRLDLVSVSSAGVLTYTAGTAASLAAVKPPAIPAGNVALAFLTVPPTATEVGDDQIIDHRVFLAAGFFDVNVADYGVVGDDSANDRTAIQAAIDATPDGGTLVFPRPPVKYKISGGYLDISARRINIVGAGASTIIRQASATTDAIHSDLDILTTYTGTGPDNNRNYDRVHTIRNIRIEGPTGGGSGSAIYGLTDINLDNVQTYGFYVGLYLDWKSYYARATNCKFSRATHAALLHKGYNFTALNCEFWNSAYGTWCSGNQNMRFIGCVYEQNSSANAYVDGALQGSLTQPASSFSFIGCYFEAVDTGTPDIFIGDTTAVTDVLIAANHFQANAQGDTGASWHIDIDRGTAVTISTNRLYGGGTGGGDIRATANTVGLVLINQIDAVVDGLPVDTAYLDKDHLAAPPTSLEDLTDTTIVDPIAGEDLRWNGAAWVNAAEMICVDPGTPTVDDGDPFGVTITSVWGVDAGDGTPYYNGAGVDAGDEAALFYDPLTEAYTLVAYAF